MASQFACPHCGGGIAVDPRLSGQLAVCPHCSRQFQFPPVAIPVASAAPSSAPPSGSFAAKRTKKANPTTAILVISGAALFFFLCCLGVLTPSGQRGSPPVGESTQEQQPFGKPYDARTAAAKRELMRRGFSEEDADAGAEAVANLQTIMDSEK